MEAIYNHHFDVILINDWNEYEQLKASFGTVFD